MNRLIIAIDGFAACGKSTLARQLAHRLGYTYIDSGAMYRAVTLHALQNGIAFSDEAALTAAFTHIRLSFVFNNQTNVQETYLNDTNVERLIWTKEVAENVSLVSTYRAVRQAMVAQQRLMGERKGIVMDGRDIGTVVFPQAELKLFLTADISVRVQRRYDELQAKGMPLTREEVEKNLLDRDRIDFTRAESPLRKADDAITIDNTHLSPEEQLNLALSLVEEKANLMINN